MKIILLATHTNPFFENTLSSLTTSGIVPSILGQGEKWKGWKWRLEKYLDFCNVILKLHGESILPHLATNLFL